MATWLKSCSHRSSSFRKRINDKNTTNHDIPGVKESNKNIEHIEQSRSDNHGIPKVKQSNKTVEDIEQRDQDTFLDILTSPSIWPEHSDFSNINQAFLSDLTYGLSLLTDECDPHADQFSHDSESRTDDSESYFDDLSSDDSLLTTSTTQSSQTHDSNFHYSNPETKTVWL